MPVFAILAASATCYFAWRAWQQPRPTFVIAAVLWLLAASYEAWFNPGADCVGGCNIRVDLVVILPVLLIATLFALLSPARRWVAAKIILAIVAAHVVFFLALEAYFRFFNNLAAQRTGEIREISPK